MTGMSLISVAGGATDIAGVIEAGVTVLACSLRWVSVARSNGSELSISGPGSPKLEAVRLGNLL